MTSPVYLVYTRRRPEVEIVSCGIISLSRPSLRQFVLLLTDINSTLARLWFIFVTGKRSEGISCAKSGYSKLSDLRQEK